MLAASDVLTKLTIRNFKRFTTAEIELGNPVVFIGPNNSGKTTALQAIALWEVGLRRWNEKRGGKETAAKRPGVAINRKDLIAVPIPDANLLWKDLHVRDVRRRADGRPDTRNIRVDIVVEGVTNDRPWVCGLEFDYANEESLYCRPLRKSPDENPERMLVPEDACATRVAFLPPMSGLADREFVKQPGEIGFLIGQGRTAEVLRNLCLQVLNSDSGGSAKWRALVDRVKNLFGIELNPPAYSVDRSEITMTYRESSDAPLDLSSAGRGVHQTLLLPAHLYLNPNSVLPHDEPDAPLEILRQRQIYNVLSEAAREQESQVVIASHSEVLLNEAAARDVVVAFVGRPHRLNDRPNQLLKALKDIGFEDYYQADAARLGALSGRLHGSRDLAGIRRKIATCSAKRPGVAICPLCREPAPTRARPLLWPIGSQAGSGRLPAERQDGTSAAGRRRPYGGHVGEARDRKLPLPARNVTCMGGGLRGGDLSWTSVHARSSGHASKTHGRVHSRTRPTTRPPRPRRRLVAERQSER